MNPSYKVCPNFYEQTLSNTPEISRSSYRNGRLPPDPPTEELPGQLEERVTLLMYAFFDNRTKVFLQYSLTKT